MPACSYGAALADFARDRPDAPALTSRSAVMTWAELDARSTAAAHRLARHGVRAGDVVAFAGPNHPDQLLVIFAVWKLGAVPFPVPGARAVSEMDELVRLADPVLLIDLPDSTTGIPAVAAADLTSDPVSAAPLPLPDVPAGPMRIGASGGSTGRPKLTALDTPAIVNPARPWPPGMRPNGTHLVVLNLTDGAGFTMATQGLGTGSHVVLAESDPEPADVLELASRYSVTWMMLTPPVMLELWKVGVDERSRHDLSSLSICSGGGGVAPWLKRAWIDWIGPDRVWEFYAGSDGRASATIDGATWLAHQGSVGRVDPGGEIGILDSDGRPVGPNVVGDVYLRDLSGRRNFHYIGADLKTLPGGWETLGDVGWIDDEGYIFLLDRVKDVIRTADGLVYPIQIEMVLEEHDVVRSAIVIGLPDGDEGDERIHAIVDTCGRDVTVEDLRRHLAALVPERLMPSTFELTSARLRDRAGKARRSQLRQDRLSSDQQARPRPA